MRTDLNAKGSLFDRARQDTGLAPTGNTSQLALDDYSEIKGLVDRINLAMEERDVESLPFLELEVQARSLIMLKMIDWKMWEIYNKFIRT